MAVPTRPVSGQPIETAWGNVAHDTAVAQDIQSGTCIAPATAGGVDNSSIAVVFPRPFASAPNMYGASIGTGAFIVTFSAVTATGFTLTNSGRTAGTGSLGARSNYWLAIGPRA